MKLVPNNRDQAAALASFHRDRIDPSQTLLVEDRREGDHYVDSLREAFREYTSGARYSSEQFTSPGIEEAGTTANQFAQMVATICTSPARWIYFVGRPLHMRVFINALGERGCTDRHVHRHLRIRCVHTRQRPAAGLGRAPPRGHGQVQRHRAPRRLDRPPRA